MTQLHQQNHATWECQYHVVFHELARRRESKIEEGHLMPDHVHMLISIPPKYSVAEVIGFIKGKSSIWIRLRPPPVGPGRGPNFLRLSLCGGAGLNDEF